MPACVEVVAVEAEARRPSCPPKSAGRRRNAPAFLSITATVWSVALERAGELAAHPAASDDDDVHAASRPTPDGGCYERSPERAIVNAG